ncbi:MAG: phosphoribosyltransferase family protein [Pseudomonadota bacterium]
MKKTFIDAEALLLDSYRLGVQIYQDGFRPDFIIGLWRGGSSVGIAVQDCLEYLGVETDHISARTSYRGMSSYADMVEQDDNIRVHGLQYVFDNLNNSDSLLIVDDVYSTGLSVKAVIDRLSKKMRKNMAADVRIATPWYKPSKNQTGHPPNYYLYETDDWLVFPYELDGLTLDEIKENKPQVKEIIDGVIEFLPQAKI